MKRIISVAAYIALCGGVIWAATKQPQPMGAVALAPMTVAQLAALTGNTTGYVAFCTDCTTNGGKGTICVSTGAFANSFVLSTGTVCK